MKKQNKSAFTLVELIVVITILAILGTIAFISLQWYSKQARDSKRIADISNIKTSLELFSLNTWNYPTPDQWQAVTYSWETVWTQWFVWDNVATNLSRNLQKKPTDPLFDTEYIYSLAYSKREYEVLSIHEWDVASNNLLNTTYASSYTPRINWNYNQIFVKTQSYILPTPSLITSEDVSSWLALNDINIDSQIITWWNNFPVLNIPNTNQVTWWLDITLSATWMINEDSTTAEKESVILAIQNAYSSSPLASNSIYSRIINTSDAETLAEELVLNAPTWATTNTTTTYSCTWTLPSQNVSTSNNTWLTSDTPWQNTAYWDDCYYECTWWYTWDNCDVEPALVTSTDCSDAWWYWVNDTLDTMWDWYCISPRIEWNGDTAWISWNDTWTSATRRAWDNISYATTEWLANNAYWITAYLSNYTCWALDSWHTDVLNYWDTIKWRMKWLTGYANTNNNYTALNDIDWINITLNTSNVFPIPSIYIADCIDWVKDLTTDIILWAETITWSNYTSTTNSDATRTARNKYLLWWAKTSWSHLPSAYSSIDYEVWDNLTWDARWEYQVACENNATIWWDLTTDSSNERIWLSAVGSTDGTGWGRGARIVGYSGCGDQSYGTAGGRYTTRSARFVVRP